MGSIFSRRVAMAAAPALLLFVGTALASQEADAQQLFQQGRWDEAAQAYESIAEEQPENQQAWYRLGYALHALGRYDEALPAHERAAALAGPAQATASYNAACASALLERPDDACSWLQKAVASGFGSSVTIDTDPDLEAIRDDPRFLGIRNPLVEKTRFRTFRGTAQKGNRDQFDFWIGDWESARFSLSPTGTWTPGGGLVSRVYEVLGGNALVEWSASSQAGGPTQGFSIRTFDPARNEWIVLLNWPSREKPSFYVLTGQFRRGRCELVSPLFGPGGANQNRFTFSDVSPNAYRWDNATTTDGGKTWSTTLIFEGQRREKMAAPLRTGPSKSYAHCSGPSFRKLDFRLGTWLGTRRTRGPDDAWSESSVRLHCYSVMDGSAIVDEEVVGSGEHRRETFAIQCFEPARGKWVRYSIDDREPRFRRREAVVGDGPIEMVGTPGPGSTGAPGTLVLTPPAPDAGGRELQSEWREDGDIRWRQTLRAVD